MPSASTTSPPTLAFEEPQRVRPAHGGFPPRARRRSEPVRGRVGATRIKDTASPPFTRRATPALDPAALTQVPEGRWGDIRLGPCAWYRWLDFEYPVDRYYQAFRDDLEPSVPAAMPTTTVVLRDAFAIRRIDVAPTTRELLRRLLAGATLGNAMSSLEPDVDGAEVQQSFQTWVASALFSTISLGAP